MKLKKLTAALLSAAVMLAGTGQIPASAADTAKQIPNDYDSALEFLNTYGVTRINRDNICFVFPEPVTEEGEEPVYAIAGLDAGGTVTYREVFTSPDGRSPFQLEVIRVLTNPGCYFYCTYTSDVSDPDSAYTYIFETDNRGVITETDLYGWVPDCPAEYSRFTEENGKIGVHGRYLAYCIENNAGTAYSWSETAVDSAAQKVLVSQCSGAAQEMVPGARTCSVHVYKVLQDGQLTVTWDLCELAEGGTGLPAETLTETFCAVDNVSAVLRPDEVYFRMLDAGTGKLLTLDPDNLPVLDVRTEYLLDRPGKEDFAVQLVNGDVPVRVDSYTITENPIVLPIAEAFRNAGDRVSVREGTEPAGYRIVTMNTAVQKNRSCIVDAKFRYVIRGDVNFDGEFGMSDLVLMTRWLLCENQAWLRNWAAGDMNEDNRLDSRDLVLMKRLLMTRPAAAHCTLTVETSYSGFGVMGQPLGSGAFTQTFDVTEGDLFYEYMDGTWHPNDGARTPILRVERITEDGVLFTAHYRGEDQQSELAYDAEELYPVSSTFVVYDGINYSHGIRFGGYTPAGSQ